MANVFVNVGGFFVSLLDLMNSTHPHNTTQQIPTCGDNVIMSILKAAFQLGKHILYICTIIQSQTLFLFRLSVYRYWPTSSYLSVGTWQALITST